MDPCTLAGHLPRNLTYIAWKIKESSFTVPKTKKVFSTISIDQAHEQNNAHIKGDGGAVCMTDNPCAQQCWMIAGSEAARVIAEFQARHEHWGKRVDTGPHDQTPSVQSSSPKMSARLSAWLKNLATLLRKRVWIWLSLTQRKWQIFLKLNWFGMSKG